MFPRVYEISLSKNMQIVFYFVCSNSEVCFASLTKIQFTTYRPDYYKFLGFLHHVAKLEYRLCMQDVV